MALGSVRKLLGDVESATALLLATVESFSDEDLRTPSLCRGWTRGHVLAHVALNADSIVNLLTWARTGEETPQYPSQEARDAAISANATLSPSEHLSRLVQSHERFLAAALSMPDENWTEAVRGISGDEQPVHNYLSARRREVEVHHVDLDAGYGPEEWPADFIHNELAHAATRMGARLKEQGVRLIARDIGIAVELGPEPRSDVRGSGADLLTWLYGRSSGVSLAVEPEGPLPDLGPWG